MYISKSYTRAFSLFILSLVLTALAACSSSSDTATTGTGTVALLVTDAPSDIFEEINITVTKAELLSDDGNVTIFEGENTFNLLELTDATIFAIRDGVPVGTYKKIRLTLSDIQLVDYMGTDDPADDLIVHPKLPAGGKLDLKAKEKFTIVSGGTLTLQLDMDAEKSIHIVKKGDKDEYNFRPVVFIDVVTDSFINRYVKLHGDISTINSTAQTFMLCNTGIVVKADEATPGTTTPGCINVKAGEKTSIFNNSGIPAVFADLVAGQPATVFGRLKQDDDDDEIEHEEEVEQEELTKDDDDDEEEAHEDERELHDLYLQAALIELGAEASFQKINGAATSGVGIDNQFTMNVAPGQGLVTPLSLNIQIQDGTLVINRKGKAVDPAAITSGKLLKVRGVLNDTTNTVLATVIVVHDDSTNMLSGTVGSNPDSVCGFALATATGDRSVKTDDKTNVFMITADSSSPITVAELISGQQVDVYGEYDDGCFEADTIIAY